MTNQEALENLFEYAEMGCSTWDSKNDNESISNSKQVLQQALDELQNLKENYIGFEDMNYELKVYKKAFEKTWGYLEHRVIIVKRKNHKDTLDKNEVLEQARKELENDN